MGEPRPLDVLGAQLYEAWTEMQLARVDCLHSPNADTIRVQQYAELRFDRLLGRLWEAMSDKQKQATVARPVRQLVDAG